MNAMFPRQQIAEQISDLRQMRNHLSDLTMAACRLMSSDEVPEEIKAQVSAALEAAHTADQIAQDRIRQLYSQPSPKPANAA